MSVRGFDPSASTEPRSVSIWQVTYITLGICAFTWLSVFAMLMALAPQLSMTADMPVRQSAAIVSLAATLMMARSPASMVRSNKAEDLLSWLHQ